MEASGPNAPLAPLAPLGKIRDYLIAHPRTARAYERLKFQLAAAHANDRAAYTNAKTAFVKRTTAQAKTPH